MPRSPGQKLKLLYILDMLKRESDEKHPVTTKELIEELARHGISAERKSIYDDIDSLTDYGADIVKVDSRSGGGYYLASREFELAEVKLLVDAVSSSRFITVKKSRELIRKLELLSGKHQAKQLQRQVYVSGRVKTENESIYYGIDSLNEAIQENSQICFHYSEWNAQKKLVYRQDGKLYRVSPWALLWSNELYYLLAYQAQDGILKHYRVDKISDVTLTGEEREGRELYEALDMVQYVNRIFGMYGGREEKVMLKLHPSVIGVVLDRFGKDIFMMQDRAGVRARVDVTVSSQFFGWLASLGDRAILVGPQSVREEYTAYLQNILHAYR